MVGFALCLILLRIPIPMVFVYMFGVVTIATYENYYKCPVSHIFYYFGIVYIDLVAKLVCPHNCAP